MNIGDAIKALNSGGGVKMIIPSFKQQLMFKQMNTGIQKTLGRIALSSSDIYNSGMIRLALFDEMILEGTHEYKASMLKIVDMIAFITQLKMQNAKTIDVSVTCQKCGAKTEIKFNLEKILENCIKHVFRNYNIKVSGGNPKHNYEFIMTEPYYMDSLILSESVKRSQNELSETLSEAEMYYIYSKLCLYISAVKFDGKEITGNEDQKFSRLPVPDRLKFFDSIDQSITIESSNKNSLLNFIAEKFSEEDLSKDIFKESYSPMACKKDGCGNSLESVMTYDNFFTV